MIKLEMKSYNMILIKRLEKYQSDHQAKLISMNILQVKNISPINFIGFRDPMHVYNSIKNGNVSIEKIIKRPKTI